MLAKLVDDDSELISLYYGQDVLAEDAEKFAEMWKLSIRM